MVNIQEWPKYEEGKQDSPPGEAECFVGNKVTMTLLQGSRLFCG